MTFSLASDSLLCALLVIVIYLAIKLERRLADMRNGNQDLARLVASLDSAIEKANSSIVNLRLAAREADEALYGSTNRARAMADELSIVVGSADRLSAHLVRASEPPTPAALPEMPDLRALHAMLTSAKGLR